MKFSDVVKVQESGKAVFLRKAGDTLSQYVSIDDFLKSLALGGITMKQITDTDWEIMENLSKYGELLYAIFDKENRLSVATKVRPKDLNEGEYFKTYQEVLIK